MGQKNVDPIAGQNKARGSRRRPDGKGHGAHAAVQDAGKKAGLIAFEDLGP